MAQKLMHIGPVEHIQADGLSYQTEQTASGGMVCGYRRQAAAPAIGGALVGGAGL